jgi:hypothetical protein
METNPTPRPWTIGEGKKLRTAIRKVALSGKSFTIATVEGLSEADGANAKLIVQAVNERDALLASHAKLLEICKESKSWHEIEKGMEPIYWNGFKKFERRLEEAISEAEKI